MKDKVVSVLYEHYKDTFSHIREREKQRNSLFLLVLIILGLQVLQLNFALTLDQVLKEVIVVGLSMSISQIPSAALISISWVLLVVFIMQYYQVTLHIEKQYDYLHKLELELNRVLDNKICISRESNGYMTKKGSLFRHWIWLFYTLVIPIIIVIVIGWCLILEWNTEIIPDPHRWFDSVIGAIGVISVVFYAVSIWLKQ